MPSYEQLLDSLRNQFPSPVSDPVHDGYVAFSLLRALDQVDSLKSDAPVLGTPREPDWDAAVEESIAEHGRTTEEVLPELVRCLHGMPIWGHPRSQVNVIAYPTIASVIGVVLPSLYNPNLCSDESGRGFSEAEVRVTAMIARLVGYDPASVGGLFTFGGTGTLLYGVKLGLERALPGAFQHGIRDDVVLIASRQSHYACLNVAGWLGIGQQNVLLVETNDDNSMNVAHFEQVLCETMSAGRRIAAIIATMGTTDAFGLDDLAAIRAVRDHVCDELNSDYRPHLHADSVIGWAWSVFRDYDFHRNPLGFRGRTTRALAAAANRIRHLTLADSLGVDFHKTGFTPYISSMLLVRDRTAFDGIVRRRETMPYLFHSGTYHPGMFSLETSRGASGVMAALANLLLLGKEGLRALLGHAVEMQSVLRETISARPELSVVNDDNVGPVTLFRAYPDDVDTFQALSRELHEESYAESVHRHNELNARIFDAIQQRAIQGAAIAIGFTSDCRHNTAGEPINALKSYVLSPFVTELQMRSVVEQVLAARREILANFG
ncbi:MAG: aspartate aminotransferase family protein [Planctomycetales bacterium]|nr:aspartate aminotransferase family protein [Planctomycetales bacterium]